ncbi:MAG: histidine--tRNA ligase [Patescibacteria group bacterium]|nr:histidine--tRNA ligase [Patescibacteria group bacterium]MBU1160664.1 histidine--tRNA ligase [Patescibacteria group bacterium]MBU1987223.1 histidine--tRNA ligase [Patescibacteria group bacterium]
MPRRKKNKQAIDKDLNKKYKKITRLKGMKDVSFNEYKYWDLVITKATDLAKIYGFQKIQTPVLENLELYNKSSGPTSDVVTKEMYSFVDKNGEKIALRPEATPGLVRAYIENGMFNMSQPIKMFWLGPIFRHDKPQLGRYRESYQFDLEIFNEFDAVADFLIILIAYKFFCELQIKVQIQINSIGCSECRGEYIAKLTEFYKTKNKKSQLCNNCKKKLVKNPLRLLDCKEEKCIKLYENIPQIVDYLCDDCKNHFVNVLEYLDELDVNYILNPHLVRGLDYYNRTVFEILPVDTGADENKISLGGGGRYDNLVQYMGGRSAPACGMAIGIERTILQIKKNNISIKKNNNKNLIFIAQLGKQAKRKTFILFEELRKAGLNVRQSFTKNSLKSQLEDADKIGAKFSLILGQQEIIDKTILLRNMESGTQEIIDYDKIKIEIEKRLKIN